jgi:RNA polymerase sigma factor (sigma-70 family)
VQQGFANALRRRDSYRGSGSLEAWVARCVINAAHDASRADANMRDAADAHGPMDSSAEADPRTAIVREAVRRLPQRQRDALFLRYYLGFDYATIASVLDVEIGTVSAALHAARASLAENLKEVPN